MSKNIVSRRLSVHKEHEVLLKLEAAGFGDPEAQAIVESQGNELAIKTVAYIRRGGYEATTSQRLARGIMGENFLGVEEASQHFGVRFGGEELVRFDEILFPEAVLKECKDTHILFVGFPLTILDVRSKVSRDLFWQHASAWYNNQAFAKTDRVRLRWYLIRKDIVPGSTNEIYQEQLAMLSEDEEVPRACEVVYMTILYFLATGTRLFENIYARCQDETRHGTRIRVSFFREGGLAVDQWLDDADHRTGVAASRKIPS